MVKEIINLKDKKSMMTRNNNRLMLTWMLLRWLSKKKRHRRQQLTICDIRRSKKMKRSWHITIIMSKKSRFKRMRTYNQICLNRRSVNLCRQKLKRLKCKGVRELKLLKLTKTKRKK